MGRQLIDRGINNRKVEIMRCKVTFRFDNYKGTAEIEVPGKETLEELKKDKQLPEYVKNSSKSNLNYREYEKKGEPRFEIDVHKNKDHFLILDGSLLYTDLGSYLAEVKVLDKSPMSAKEKVDTGKVKTKVEDEQLELF